MPTAGGGGLTRQTVRFFVFNSDFRPRSGRSKFRFSDFQARILQTRSGVFAIYRSCMFVLTIIGHRLAFPIGGRTFSTSMQRYTRDLPFRRISFLAIGGWRAHIFDIYGAIYSRFTARRISFLAIGGWRTHIFDIYAATFPRFAAHRISFLAIGGLRRIFSNLCSDICVICRS